MKNNKTIFFVIMLLFPATIIAQSTTYVGPTSERVPTWMQANVENIQLALSKTHFLSPHQQSMLLSTLQVRKAIGQTSKKAMLPEFRTMLGAPINQWKETLPTVEGEAPILAMLQRHLPVDRDAQSYLGLQGGQVHLDQILGKSYLGHQSHFATNGIKTPMNMSLQTTWIFNQTLLSAILASDGE